MKASLFENHVVGDRHDWIVNQRLRLSAERHIRRHVVARRDERASVPYFRYLCTSAHHPRAAILAAQLCPRSPYGQNRARARDLHRRKFLLFSRALPKPSFPSVWHWYAKTIFALCTSNEHPIQLHSGPSAAL